MVGAVLLLSALLVGGCATTAAQPTESPAGTQGEVCVDRNAGARLSYEEAVEIARNSGCTEQGQLKETRLCNADTGTWWIDLDVDQPGCQPACVVDLNERSAEINWRCTGALPPQETAGGPEEQGKDSIGDDGVGMANPASVYCVEQGFSLEMRTDANGGQYGACVFPEGGECEEWAFFRGECSPAILNGSASKGSTPPPPESWTEPVDNWWGEIISNPPGSQWDDCFQRQIVNGGQYGIESLDPEVQAQIVALRDTGETVHVWGTLHHNVPDVGGAQIQVTRLKVQDVPAAPPVTEEPVEGWMGTLVKLPNGSQVSGYFERDDGQRFGIAPLEGDATVRQQIETYRWTGARVQVWGQLLSGVPDAEGRQMQVERIEALSGPSTQARNLALFASASASSVLPSDRWGTYHAWSAIDGLLSTPWSEGADGPGIGEWIMLTFPGAVEVQSIGVSVGYDRDPNDVLRSPEVFEANNRLERATLVFSNGEQVPVDFTDTRGVQVVPLVRAPGPNIETDFVKLVIEEVYAGSRYDDTCLAEIEVWGITK